MELRDLIGVPYRLHGRDLNGLDCYGLARLAIDILTGIKMPDIVSYMPETLTKNTRYIKLEKVEKNCIIVFNGGAHCGVYLGYGEFIHCNENGVNIAQLNNWQCRVSGYYKVCNN